MSHQAIADGKYLIQSKGDDRDLLRAEREQMVWDHHA